MAVRIEKGGWALIFLAGAGLVAYALHGYGVVDLSRVFRTPPGAAARKAERADAEQGSTGSSSTAVGPNVVRVGVNIRVGCAAGLVANGGLDTQADSIYGRKRLKVSFKVMDAWAENAAALAANNVDVMLTTADVWAKDHAQFEDRGFRAHAVLLVDWSRGADGVIARQGINSIEDLAGKKVAFAPFTPSHFLLWNGLKSSGLGTVQRSSILNKAVRTKDGIDPAALFEEGKADAAAAWDPAMSDAVLKRSGSKKIFDTRIANRLIADILVTSDAFAARAPQTLAEFLQGWLEGVGFIRESPIRAYTLIGNVKQFDMPADVAKAMLEGVRLADFADNRRFFGTKNEDSEYTNIFRQAQEMYRELRVIKKNSDAEDSADRRYLDKLGDRGVFPSASTESAIQYKPPASGAAPLFTERLWIFFDPNSTRIASDSRPVLDELGGFMRAYENTVVEIAGNTDASGSRDQNVKISNDRAQSIKQYLIERYGFPAERIFTAGNGPDRPIDSNDTPEGRERNARTDVKIYANQGS